MAETFDAEFFLDPICPWCWITSRWVVNVQAERGYTIGWRFIALRVLNEEATGDYSPGLRASHVAGFHALRVADAVRGSAGNDAVGRFYTAVGTAIHNQGRRDELIADPVPFLAEALEVAGLDAGLAPQAHDEVHDARLRAETAAALARTGPGVGTPIITFGPGTTRERSLFGPVIPRAPRGEHAVRLWDAVVTVAESDVAELKRSLRGDRVFD